MLLGIWTLLVHYSDPSLSIPRPTPQSFIRWHSLISVWLRVSCIVLRTGTRLPCAISRVCANATDYNCSRHWTSPFCWNIAQQAGPRES